MTDQLSLLDHPSLRKSGKGVVYFDLETQRSADEVGGWNNIHKMGLSVGVIWSSATGAFKAFQEKQVKDLINDLFEADLVVGYNLLRFDYTVLTAYTGRDFRKINTLDMLVDIQERTGIRPKLDDVARATLGKNQGKSADGLQALEWFQEGRLDLITEYCQQDVKVTKDVHEFGVANGFVKFHDRKTGQMIEVKVDWATRMPNPL
ncbi:MAG: hypothetical protein GMKNLPBB_02773 [Myxococcota bacterium]|nr:hypothetical protein [Myxococcota bacterium]